MCVCVCVMYALNLMAILLVRIRMNYLIESLTLSNSRQRFLIQWKRINMTATTMTTNNKAFNRLESERLWFWLRLQKHWCDALTKWTKLFTNIQLRQSLCRKRMHFVSRQEFIFIFFVFQFQFNCLAIWVISVLNFTIEISIDWARVCVFVCMWSVWRSK